MGGDVRLYSSASGTGSTFLITIDPGSTERVLFRNFDQALRLYPEADAPLPSLEGRKILVVDDSFDNRTLVMQFLRSVGASVEMANNGKEGVEKALTGKFDLVLMDLQMPVMDGYAATKELRRRGYEGPIVALTAHAMKDERRRCLEGGFNEHLSKPIDRASLSRTIARYIEA